MGFFGGLKSFAGATVNTLSNGSELLLHAAIQMERGSKVILLETEIEHFEKLLELPYGRDLTRAQRVELQQNIIDRCRQVIDIQGEKKAAAELSKLRSLEMTIRQEGIEHSLAQINQLQALRKTQTFELPIDEITHLNRLKSSCEQHVVLLKADSARAHDLAQTRALITQVQDRITALQPLRSSVEEIFYSSGAKAGVIRRYDGYRQGLSEFWYEDGQPRLTVEYAQDQAEGAVCVYAPSGVQVASGKVSKSQGTAEWTLQLAPEKTFLAMNQSKATGELRFWLWNGAYAGWAPMHGGHFRLAGFFTRLVFKPVVWRATWQLRKPGHARDELERMKNYVAIWGGVQDEIFNGKGATRLDLSLQGSRA